ncbi:MAG TPA: pilus assembly protein [Oligoflexia bacterium]|nr:pilus assembly protein [Oligoflexia bacterium]
MLKQHASCNRRLFNAGCCKFKLKQTEPPNERASAMVELAIVLPLLMLICIGTIEYSRMFSSKEIMSLAAREAANEAFRECYETSPAFCSDGVTSAIDACLERYVLGIGDQISKGLPGVGVIMSMYAQDKLGTISQIGSAEYDPEDIAASHFSVPIIQANFNALLVNKKSIVVAEIFYNHPVTFKVDFIPRIQLYEATVF